MESEETSPSKRDARLAAPTPLLWARAREESNRLVLQAAIQDIEVEAVKLRQQRDDFKSEYESGQEALQAVKEELRKVKTLLSTKEGEFTDLQREAKTNSDRCALLEQDIQAKGERMDRTESEADSLREEISRLVESNKQFKEQVTELESQVKLGDSEVVPLRYEVQRLRSEIDSISNHANWLESEHRARSEELAATRSQQAADLAGLRAQLDKAISEKESSSFETANVRRDNEKLNAKVESLSKDVLRLTEEATDDKKRMEEELVAERRLVGLQKEQLDRLGHRHDHVVHEMETMQKMAVEAEQESRRELEENKQKIEVESKKILEEQAASHKSEMEEVKRELEEAQKRCRQAEEGLLVAVPAHPGRRQSPRQQPLAIQDDPSNTAIVATEEPINLTDLYTRLAETEDDLAIERTKRKRAELLFTRIEAEIKANAPVLVRQRQEYELALERQEEYKKRLDEALSESQAYRTESSDLQVGMSRIQKRNKELEEETIQLAKQVQALLGSRSDAGETSEIPTSVEEIQNQNQQLLREHRRLTTTVSELETQINSDPLRNKLESAEKELATLKDDRQRQEVLVESIVQQRDLYRALLSKHDSNLLGNESEETSALQIVKQQSERSKNLEQRITQQENDLIVARTELAALEREKTAASERLARYETLTADLTKSVDELQVQLSSAKADVARSGADASFHREKTQRLEETLQRSRDEVSRVTAAKNEWQRTTSELQKAISVANAEASAFENRVQQAEAKLRLAETQAETAKAAERRISEEAKGLRTEISKQGSLLESVQRIEANLSAKNAAEQESLTEQLALVKRQQSAEQSKYASEIDELKARIQDQELQIKEIERSREKASNEAIDAKKESLEANTEMQNLLKKCSSLETNLEKAKKQLGITSGDGDTEAEAQNKINDLSQELEEARAEIEKLKERCSTYQKLAKNSETTLADLNAAMKDAKKEHSDASSELKGQLEVVRTESSKRQEVITELTNDLVAHRGEQEKAEAKLKVEISSLKSEVEKYQKDADAAAARSTSFESEVAVLRSELSTAQDNYERELALHASARTSLRVGREEAETEGRLRKAAQVLVGSLKSEHSEQARLWGEEKESLQKQHKQLESDLSEARALNNILHGQLDTVRDQVEKIRSEKISEATEGGDPEATHTESDEVNTLMKTVSEYREVVKFLRSDKEMIQAQLDSARREAEREKAAAAVVKRSLDEARAELKVLQDSAPSLEQGTAADGNANALKEKLLAADEKIVLLGDSNKHLREEVENLQSAVSSLQKELDSAKLAAQPSEKRQQTLEIEKAALVAEKESLIREIDTWKKRVQSLVAKFNQIDPEEHAKALKQVETLEAEVKSLTSKKGEAENESRRIRTLATRASKELMQNKSLVETQKKTIAKLTSEKEALAKSSKDTAQKKELDQLKEKVENLQKERSSDKVQLKGATEINDKLRGRLRQFQKLIGDLKKKEASLNEQLKASQSEVEKLKEAKKTFAVASSKEGVAAATSGSTPSSPRHSGNTDEKAAASSGTTTMDAAEAGSTSTKENQASVPTTAKETPKVLPKVPPGGFKFAPSVVGQTAGSNDIQASDDQKQKSVSQEKDSKKSTATSTGAGGSAQRSKKRGLSDVKEDSGPDTKKAAISEKKDDKALEASKSAGEEAATTEKASESSAKPTLHRRNSGEKKELSIKEKLLEKKRKLQMAMKKAKEAKVAQDDDKDAERSKKRSKTVESQTSPKDESEKDEAQGKAIPESPAADTPKASPKASSQDGKSGEASKSAKKEDDGDETEEGEMDDTPGETDDKGDEPKEPESDKVTESKDSAAPATPATPAFGSAGTASAFGGSAFGQAAGATGGTSAFGKGSGFGSGASTAFGAQSAETTGGASVFGKPSTSSGSGSFGALLNMKPPGSSTSPPQFSFGTSGSIKLPTPSQKSPANTLFSAFSTNKAFTSGGVTAKPLFSTKKDEKPEETKSEDADEEGEIEDDPNQPDC